MRPTRTLLLALAAWFLLGVTAAFVPGLEWSFWAAGLGLLLVALFDGWMGRRLPELAIERRLPGVLPLGVWSDVKLRVRFGRDKLTTDRADPNASTAEGEGSLGGTARVFDHPPEAFEFVGLPRPAAVLGGGWSEISYRVKPNQRGDHRFRGTEVQRRSPWRLWFCRQKIDDDQLVRVLPNFRPVSGYAILALENRLGQMGIRLTRRRGEGLDFQQLRDYREGDSPRQLDWAATARIGKPISRQYQDEKDQQLVFLIDCGRRMHARDGELSHFDHVLNAVLLLTYVALRQGDSVGFLTFAGADRWLPPQKGAAAMNTVLERVYDLQTTTAPSDYLAAAEKLAILQRRRSLVVLVSNLRDEDSSELLPALRLLRTRNLVLLASLREHSLDTALQQPIHTLDDAIDVSAVHHYLAARERAWEAVAGQGVLTLDTEPEDLPLRVVNRYLDIKRSGAL